MFASQTGAEYGIIPMIGRLKGKPVNYDGKTKYDEGKHYQHINKVLLLLVEKTSFMKMTLHMM